MAQSSQTSKHAVSRMKERTGRGKARADEITKRVLKHGIKASETTKQLKEWVEKKPTDAQTSLYIYAGSLYIFKGQVLVTTYTIPQTLYKRLDKCVEQNAYVRYRRYRDSLRRFVPDENKKTDKPMLKPSTVKMLCTRFFKDNNIPFTSKEVIQISEDTFKLYYTLDKPISGTLHVRKVINWGKNSRGIRLFLQCENPDMAIKPQRSAKRTAKKTETIVAMSKRAISEIRGIDPMKLKTPTKKINKVAYGQKKNKETEHHEEWENWLLNTSLM